MFVEDQESAYINTIVAKIREVDPAKADKVAAAYDYWVLWYASSAHF